LNLRLEVTENNGDTTGLIITQENGITALRSISLAKVGFKCGGAIVTLGRKSNFAEFVEKHQPKRGPFLPECRDIIETFV
jgi:hypothetical protein